LACNHELRSNRSLDPGAELFTAETLVGPKDFEALETLVWILEEFSGTFLVGHIGW
jgi:hypothetical protein